MKIVVVVKVMVVGEDIVEDKGSGSNGLRGGGGGGKDLRGFDNDGCGARMIIMMKVTMMMLMVRVILVPTLTTKYLNVVL